MNLLIVDDQPFEIDNIRQNISLEDTGITSIDTAGNGEEAKILLLDKHIDILLCDIEMPVCNGLELLEWVREQEISVECIFLTNFPDFAYAKKAIALECLDYILKPPSEENLNNVLKKAIQKILLKRTQSMEHHYSSLWFSHQPYLIDTLWTDLISGKVPPTQEAVRQKMIELNFPGMEVMKIFLILIDTSEAQNSAPASASRRIIINNTLKAIAHNTVLNDTGYGTFIEYQAHLYFLIVYEEFGLEPSGLSGRCQKFVQDCSQILHFSPDCYLGKEIHSFQLKELADYLLSIRQNTLKNNTHVFPFGLWKYFNNNTPLPDTGILKTLLENHQYEDVLRFYKDYFDRIRHSHVIINHQLFIMKQEFLQIFYEYAKNCKINMDSFWEIPQIQSSYSHADSSVNEFIRLVSEFMDHAKETIAQFDQPASVIEQAFAYIQAHLSEDITREDVAREVCMNTDYFAKHFKKKTGLLISEYLLKCRMERACKLLKTNMSILNIAMETGFNSSTYFSTLFKKYTGKSPQDYRREL